MQGREGSGYNLNCSELAAGLALSGHRVWYLRSGMEYSLFPGMRIRPSERWRGVACHDFINSPNFSPASTNFANMKVEIAAPGQSRLVVRWLDAIGAELVHIHSLEGYGLDLIGAIRRSGRPVIVTPHNYWYGCPQVDLLRHEQAVCMDYDGGRACVGCLPTIRPAKARLARGLDQTAHRVFGPIAAGTIRLVYGHAKPAIKRLLRRGRPTTGGTIIGPDGVVEIPAVGVDAELSAGFEAAGEGDGRGEVTMVFPVEPDEKPATLGCSPIDQNERFLASDVHLTVLNEYGRRRSAGIAALNEASLVTPPSRFVIGAMTAMGMNPARGRHVRLGQPHFDQINRTARRWRHYRSTPWTPQSDRPLRLAFWGTTRNNKGLEILARAIESLEADTRRRCHFLIHAAGWDWPFRKRLLRYPEVSFWGGYDPLHLIGGMREFDVGVLPFVWFENSPLVLLEFLHGGKFVICSRLGGPPEWIVEPGQDETHPLGNGLLFPGGEAPDLVERITRIVSGRVRLPSAAEVHAVSRLVSYPSHVREVDSMYHELLGDDGSGFRGRAGRATDHLSENGAVRQEPAHVNQEPPR